jgi:F plasmid transfer operon, TraF, protein
VAFCRFFVERIAEMNFALYRIALSVALTLPGLALATPFSIFEARGFAMGGAGVASSEYAAASLYNPALLAAPSDTNRFSFIFPALGARASGSDGAFDSVKNLIENGSVDSLSASADAFSNAFNACSAVSAANCEGDAGLMSASGRVAADANLVKDELIALDRKELNLNFGMVAAVALPSWQYKSALSFNSEFFGKATPYIDSGDVTEVNTVIAGAQQFAADGSISNLAAFTDGGGNINFGRNNNDYESSFRVIGVAIADLGVSVARPFVIAEEALLVGITPKIQHVITVDYEERVGNANFKLNKSKKASTGFNVDLGVAKTFESDSRFENVRLGLVVRNLIPHTYKTVKDQDVKVAPQVRVGAAWTGKWGTVTSDLDLTANKIVGSGSDASQVFAIGGELNAWNVAKLRLGFRNDIKAKYSAITAGVSLLGVQLSGAYSKDRELAALLQFGASF